MPAIKVRATQKGQYGGHFRNPGDVFFLVDIKDPKTGKIKYPAEHFLAEEDKTPGGWMERVVAVKSGETLEAKTAREEAEAQAEAERQAAIAAGLDPDDPERKSLIVNATGTGHIDTKNQGMAHKAAPGSNAGTNQSETEVL